MINVDAVAIGSCDELASGDAIEAFCNNTLVHRGLVVEIAPEGGLFSILETVTGLRRLLNIAEFEVIRLPEHYRVSWTGRLLHKIKDA